MWSVIKTDYPRLLWSCDKNDKNRVWFFERADASFTRDNKTLFWYGINDLDCIRDHVGNKVGCIKPLGSSQSRSYTTLNSARIGIIGARGYVGRELIKL